MQGCTLSSCAGKTCGTDCCAGKCGSPCQATETCDAAGQCISGCGHNFTIGSPAYAVNSWEAEYSECQRTVYYANGQWSGTQVAAITDVNFVCGSSNVGAVQVIISWSTPPTPNTTYTLTSSSTGPLRIQATINKVRMDLDGFYAQSYPGSNVTIQVGNFALQGGGAFDFTIAAGSVMGGPNSTTLPIAGRVAGVFKQ